MTNRFGQQLSIFEHADKLLRDGMFNKVICQRRRRRRKFTSFIQPAMAYENGSVFMSGPLQQWPISMNKQISGPCATSDNAWHNEHHQKAARAPAEDHESKGSQRHNVAHHPQHERRKACICASAWAH
eukprot:GHVO01030901.1.p4 GENE.GHVO01030901.1~~GHVO01030901.1.p4  ORF type:complete len:128 (-),score=9.59 GHVO01030901.1:880-1263(-)